MAEMTIRVNGEDQKVDATPESLLLYVLRDQLELNGPKFGCGLAQCGACTVLIDGQPVRSCQTPLAGAEGAEVTTLEGLAENGEPGVVQQAFIEEQAAQCGYCINGMMMAAHALLADNPDPNDEQINQALEGNLCRCGTHVRIKRAIRRAASEGVTS